MKFCTVINCMGGRTQLPKFVKDNKKEEKAEMAQPPPTPSQEKKKHLTLFLILGGASVLSILVIGIFFGVRFFQKHGITELMDRQFGDQNLKTTVALLELHKVRYGRYPDSLKDLTYVGDWDQIHLDGMLYRPSEDRKSYYVEVEKGWVDKPTLVMPDEFWQNTGYDKRLKPKKE